jgi:hypothetical protein
MKRALPVAAVVTGLTMSLLPAHAGNGVRPWGLSGCTSVAAVVPVDVQTMDAFLPAGFTAGLPPSVAARMPDPRILAGDTLLGIEGFRCATGIGAHGETLSDPYWASLFTWVTPPAALRDDRAPRYYFYKFETLVNDRPRLTQLRAHGAAAFPGRLTVSTWQQSPELAAGLSGTAVDATLTLGSESYRFTGLTGMPVAEYFDASQPFVAPDDDSRGLGLGGTFKAFTPARGGFVVWRADFDEGRAYAGSGLVQMSAGSLAARIVGSTTAHAYLFTSHGAAYSDASLQLG